MEQRRGLAEQCSGGASTGEDKPKPVKASREPLSTNLSPIWYFAFACQTRNRLISAKGGSAKSLLTPRPFGISNSRSFVMIFEHFIVPRNNV
ncbi:hypothetical protein ALC57_09467 [Trachymyrmex cornetzi]|uniref:Uncharacterized protein n=1 Tax=Trachymyrmex cornetzi TaxID=471704 RepID=A0A151J5B9_9HYME|nr:hypothetical protein ALC57_09467 [Trachymyrmex cornetzi]